MCRREGTLRVRPEAGMKIPTALTIAGSDSSGGAGVQADLKTMSAFGVFGTSAITAITAQNTLGVRSVLHLDPTLVADQIDAVMDDVGADAAKTGMMGTAGVIEAVADRIRLRSIPNVVVDPVMVATSGAPLIKEEAVEALKKLLLPLARLVTPNVPEAEALTGRRIESLEQMHEAAQAIHEFGPANVLVKAGHMSGEATDVLFDGSGLTRFTAERVDGAKVHGTGCTLSAALASALALGSSLEDAVVAAKSFVTRGISASLDMGKGSSLVNHFVGAEEE